MAGVLSELLDCEMMPDRDSRTFVGQERITVLFVEGTAYNVLYGVRKAVKKGEVVSGDNFSVFWLRMADFMPVFQMEWGQDFRPVPRASWCLICWNSFWKPDFPRKRRFA